MTTIHMRIDEAEKTNAQIDQRTATYHAADVLRKAGIPCEVREFFTGKSKTADAAAIVLPLGDPS